MAKIFIEKHKGVDIWFDTSNGKFQTICTEEESKESESFEKVKKFIGEYVKKNLNFRSFYVIKDPSSAWLKAKMKVVGLRVDGRFVVEGPDGKKEQIPEWQEKDYILVDKDDDYVLERIEGIKIERSEFLSRKEKELKEAISMLKGGSLSSFKKMLM